MSIKRFLSVLIALPVIALTMALSAMNASAEHAKNILMVVSSHGVDGGKTQPGFEFDELSRAYLVFRDQGYTVDVASPTGGAVEADEYDPDKPYNQRVIDDKQFMAKLADTLATSEIEAADYDAVFVVGGKGAMFDLPVDEALQAVIAETYQDGRVVGAVCHGPAALVDVKLDNGEYLVAGKRVNGFTNTEEKVFGKKWVKHFPFLLEDRLIERGGLFEQAPMMLSHVAEDDRLITGQNPFSTTPTAQAMVRALGDELVAQMPLLEDVTMALVASVIDGDNDALATLENNPEAYQVELVGMYGYYSMQHAQQQEEIEHAMTFMAAANKVMQHPVLAMSIVEGHRQLGQLDVALGKAKLLAEQHPDNEKVQTLLASLSAS